MNTSAQVPISSPCSPKHNLPAASGLRELVHDDTQPEVVAPLRRDNQSPDAPVFSHLTYNLRKEGVHVTVSPGMKLI
ncbi:hypothetical protein RRG08_050026 [Elysia crispata]|uniref:Uncharacterized protein n=1 Tax=Elysia crispata TaxID=231223 RepID=A0AAE1ECZ4_9GAST|nr:hypothetical protein RRG08_050026 [Elysia crispata]